MLTKREGFNVLLEMEVIKNNSEWNDFILNEMNLLDSKGGKRATIREENEEIKKKILTSLNEEKKYLLKEIMSEVGLMDYSVPKINAIVKQLKDSHDIIRTVEKGKAYFQLAR